MSCAERALQRRHVVSAEPDGDRHPDRRAHLELAHVDPRAGHLARDLVLQRLGESRRVPLVPPLHHDQGVVGLPRLGAKENQNRGPPPPMNVVSETSPPRPSCAGVVREVLLRVLLDQPLHPVGRPRGSR